MHILKLLAMILRIVIAGNYKEKKGLEAFCKNKMYISKLEY